MTMFEKKNSVLDNTTDTGKTLSSNGNDTATPENTVSASKGMKEILDAQGNAVENSMPECVGQSPLPYPSEGFLLSILQTFC